VAKITEKMSTRVFTLEVDEKELQLIQRGLYKDHTVVGAGQQDENFDLHAAVYSFMIDNGVRSI